MRSLLLAVVSAACAADVEPAESTESAQVAQTCALDGTWELKSRMVAGVAGACADVAKTLGRYTPETLVLDGWRPDLATCEARAVDPPSKVLDVANETIVWTPLDRLAHVEGHSITVLETATLTSTSPGIPCTMRVIYGGAKVSADSRR